MKTFLVTVYTKGLPRSMRLAAVDLADALVVGQRYGEVGAITEDIFHKPHAYDLLWDGSVIATLRTNLPYSDNEVRGIAVAEHDRHPTVFADYPTTTPYAHAWRLQHAQVRKVK